MNGCVAPRARQPGAACGNPRVPGSMFCETHKRAPAARRGGWLSAARRRERMGNLDASLVFTRLWIGGAPPVDRDLPEFDILVLCAPENQPERLAFHGSVFRYPFPDATLDVHQITVAVLAARDIGDALVNGHRVLVTCDRGLNRSAFVAALTLARLTLMNDREIVQLIRARRGAQALSNDYFCRSLQRITRCRR